MRVWKWVGLAGILAGVATGAAVAREAAEMTRAPQDS